MTESIFNCSHAVTDIPAGGLHRERKASAEERLELAKALGVTAIDFLSVDYRVSGLAGGGWRLAGKVVADVVQACVVSLEPVPSRIEDSFDVEFWRALDTSEGGEDRSVLQGPDVEPLENDKIPAGRIIFETLSAALDPYPRKPGVEFGWQDKAAANPIKISPFSVLSKLKDQGS